MENICNFVALFATKGILRLLSLGVMVAHLILVQLVRVRVLEGQHSNKGEAPQ